MLNKFNTSPAWSFTRNKESEKINGTPSPDKFNPNLSFVKKTTTSTIFGKQKRLEPKFLKNNQPSPFQYDVHNSSFSSNRKVLIKFKGSFKKQQNDNPGPGSYSSKKLNQGKHFSIGKKLFQRKKIQNIAGPGKYQINRKLNQSSFTIKKDSRFKLAKISPGPGQYECKSQKYQHATNKLAKDQRFRKKKVDQYSLGRKTYQPAGSYQTKSQFTKVKGKGYSFPKKIKNSFQFIKNIVPPPGSYNVTLFNKKRVQTNIIGRQKRISFTQKTSLKQQKPSPAQYQLNSSFRSSSFNQSKSDFGKDIKLKSKQSQTPGPGRYKIQRIQGFKSSSFSIPKSNRNFKYQSQKNLTPAPNAFHIKTNTLYKNEPRIMQLIISSIQKSDRFMSKNNKTPGVGNYGLQNYKKIIKQTPKWKQQLITRFPKQQARKKFLYIKQKNSLPGPGHYNIKSQIPFTSNFNK